MSLTSSSQSLSCKLRLGLCCTFREQPIKFRNTTVTSLLKMPRDGALAKLSALCLHNANSLRSALEFCSANQIGCFRINSQILPAKTHEESGYELSDLPAGDEIEQQFRTCGELARENDIRTCFHPDQFVVLNSPREDVVERSIAELEYQAMVAEWVGADVVNIHAGGAYGDKSAALCRLGENLGRLSQRARSRLTLENDDTTYTPADLAPFCKANEIPLVYDVHHHRCCRDDLSIGEATESALATWNREPMFHISSPREGWKAGNPKPHHDYIDRTDFPDDWLGLSVTVEVEAKAKELAVLQLREDLAK